jgi:tetratricopeptide (TPR) repeat protein
MYLSKLLLERGFPLSMGMIVAHTLEAWRLWDQSLLLGYNTSTTLPPMHAGLERHFFADMFAVVLIPRMRSVEDLLALTSSLDALDEDDRNRLLGGFTTDDGELRLLFSGPWTSIKRDSDPLYDDYASALDEAIAAARRWQHIPWMRAAARARAAVLDEILERHDEARRVVTEMAREVGESPNLDDQLAIIEYNRKNYDAALQIWQRILPNWDSDERFHDMQPIFSTRCAAIAAANLAKWDLAAELFGLAITRSAGFGMQAWSVGLLGDQGYALWRSAHFTEALAVFREAVAGLEKLPNKPESFAEYAVQKLVGFVLAYLATEEDTLMATPSPGMCSALNPNEGIRQLPPTPTIYTWLLVARLARKAGQRPGEPRSGTRLAFARGFRP